MRPAPPTAHGDPYQLPDRAHDPGHEVARRRAEQVPEAARLAVAKGISVGEGSRILVGTASWTDPTLTGSDIFYPADVTTPEARLRFYASRFPLVEVDSTYYAIPAAGMAMAWQSRTPPGFVFDVKAHALMTGQPTETSRLPRDLRDALPEALRAKKRLYAKDLPAELLDEVWDRFLDALHPLKLTGKLGSILLQFPRWVRPTRGSARLIEDARRRLGDIQGSVELRHRDWFETADRTQRLLDFLRDQELAFVMVDGPQGLESSVPPLVATTSPRLAVVRLHGRRADLWEQPGVPTVERYRWLYDREQLERWVPPILDAAREAKQVHVLLNNCHGNYGTTNAVEIGGMMTNNDL